VSPEDAEEFLSAHGRSGEGWWRMTALGIRLGVPEALGIDVVEYGNRLGGYFKLPIEERREAVAELAAEGMTQKDIAASLGIGQATVSRDSNGSSQASDQEQRPVVDPSGSVDIDSATQCERGPTADEQKLIDRCQRGETVVVSLRGHHDAVITWALETPGTLVRIDRRTDWGNPFEIGDDGDRAEVIDKYSRYYLPHKPGLLAALPDLRGRVLACWCAPEACHGDVLKEKAEK
jgi:hypothetical protein